MLDVDDPADPSTGPRRGPAGFLLSGEGWPYVLVPFIPIAVALELVHAGPTLIFATAAIGVIPTAALMGKATEELADRVGPGIGGLLNVTFGNFPELLIAFFALREGTARGCPGVDHRLGPGQRPARPGRVDARRRGDPRAPEVQRQGREIPGDDAPVGVGRPRHAGGLPARGGRWPAAARNGAREFLELGGGSLPHGRDRAAAQLRRRSVVLARQPPRSVQSSRRRGGRQVGALERQALGHALGDRRPRRRSHVGDPRGLDCRDGRVRRPVRILHRRGDRRDRGKRGRALGGRVRGGEGQDGPRGQHRRRLWRAGGAVRGPAAGGLVVLRRAPAAAARVQRLRARGHRAGGDRRQPHHEPGRIDLVRGPDAARLVRGLVASFLFA